MKLWPAVALVLVAGCQNLPEDHAGTVEWFRILAVAAEPPEAPVGTSVSLTTLVVDSELGEVTADHSWHLCTLLVGAEVAGEDPDESLCIDPTTWEALGTGDSFQTLIPDLGTPPEPDDPFFFPVVVSVETDADRYWALKRVWVTPETPPNENPVVEELFIDKEPGVDPVVVPRATLVTLESRAIDPNSDDLEVEYFVTDGRIEDEPSTDLAGRVFWTTPDAETTVWVYAVVRDGRGGTAWLSRQAVVQ